MDPILIFGYPAGTSLGLVAAFEWLEMPYRLCRVDMLGEMRHESYGRLNGRHETPVLITDHGEPLSETMAIAAWMEARDDGRRISFDPRSRQADRMHQLMAFLNTGFTAAFGPLWTALELPEPDPAYEAALRRAGREAVMERHDKLEAMLEGTPWLVGQRPTLADALLAGVGRWLETHDVADIARWPGIASVRKRIESSDAFRYAAALERGEPASPSPYCVGHVALNEVIRAHGRPGA